MVFPDKLKDILKDAPEKFLFIEGERCFFCRDDNYDFVVKFNQRKVYKPEIIKAIEDCDFKLLRVEEQGDQVSAVFSVPDYPLQQMIFTKLRDQLS